MRRPNVAWLAGLVCLGFSLSHCTCGTTSCDSAVDCASGQICAARYDTPAICCEPPTHACATNADCCKGTCNSGLCSCACAQDENPAQCISDQDCCPGFYCQGATNAYDAGVAADGTACTLMPDAAVPSPPGC